ncbi:MAG: alpha-hydroxy-acid oxidizing protein [Burkholderiaceae bacterium]|nr:alpha-hydroxy-acid oxidizing protein [Burkholderiaceae bacterium]
MPAQLDKLLNAEDFRQAARRRLPKSIFEFIDGGAEDEITLRENRTAFERRRIAPRILTDVTEPDLQTDILGTPAAAPLLIAPMGSCMLAWPEADIAIARAAAAHGIPYTLSTMSTTSIERMARAVDGPLWFQLYLFRQREFNAALIERAQKAGYQAMVLTVDLQAGGKRERDLRNGVVLPLRLSLRQIVEGVTHPRWALSMLHGGLPQFENVSGYLSAESAGLTIAARAAQNLDAGFDWGGLARIRELWPGKLIVKGVLHPADAARLVAEGVDGLWVSNHGGRQLDGAIASADALPGIVEATRGDVPIVIDSGVRRGMDVLKARAMGATAAAVGRAVLFGAAVAGEAGAARVVGILIDELQRAMRLAGVPRVSKADGSLLG